MAGLTLLSTVLLRCFCHAAWHSATVTLPLPARWMPLCSSTRACACCQGECHAAGCDALSSKLCSRAATAGVRRLVFELLQTTDHNWRMSNCNHEHLDKFSSVVAPTTQQKNRIVHAAEAKGSCDSPKSECSRGSLLKRKKICGGHVPRLATGLGCS